MFKCGLRDLNYQKRQVPQTLILLTGSSCPSSGYPSRASRCPVGLASGLPATRSAPLLPLFLVPARHLPLDGCGVVRFVLTGAPRGMGGNLGFDGARMSPEKSQSKFWEVGLWA